MKEAGHSSTDGIESYLRVYRLEPIGWLLRDRLNLSISIAYLVFFALYFGVLLWLNVSSGVPLPKTFSQLLHFAPPDQYYYPNLNSIAADMIGNPLILTLMIIFRRYIPKQFLTLREDQQIKEQELGSSLWKSFRRFIQDPRAQLLLMVGLPLGRSLWGAILDFTLLRPSYPAAIYAVFLSALSHYATTVVTIQLIYIFAILSNYSLTVGLNLTHPDQCSGLTPFGNLAFATYIYLFSTALIQSIGTYGGIGPYAAGDVYSLYVWKQYGAMGRIAPALSGLLYPLTILIVVDQLLYRPHIALENYRREYLKAISMKWTKYYQTMVTDLVKVAEPPRSSKTAAPKDGIHSQIENFEAWLKLEKYILDMHTWPIPKSTFGVIAVFLNPLTPLIIQLLQEAFKLFR